MTRVIHIHAGGHRTGSSSFQLCLHDNRSILLDSGFDVAYPERDGIASGSLGLRLPQPRHGMGGTKRFAKAVQAEISLQNPDPNRPLILSEENLPGRMIHFYAGAFYPAAEARFTALRRGLGQAHIAQIVLVVRDYEDLFVSAHRKRAEDHLVDPFGQMTEAMTQFDRGWPELVAIAQSILKPAAFEIFSFENRPESSDLLRCLVPYFEGKELVTQTKNLNVSATDRALFELQKIYSNGERLDRAGWQAVIKEHASDTENLGFAKFSKAQSGILKARYRSDVQRLNQMSNIRFHA